MKKFISLLSRKYFYLHKSKLTDLKPWRSQAKLTPKTISILIIIIQKMNSPHLISSAKETLTKSKKIKKHTPSINSHLLEPRMEQKSKILKKIQTVRTLS
jgi:hypothetical protein